MQVRNRLDVLNDLGRFMAAFGWVAVGLSILIGIVSISTFAAGMGRSSAVIMGFLMIILGSMSGLVTAAMGHVMQFLVNGARGAQDPLSESSRGVDSLRIPEPAAN